MKKLNLTLLVLLNFTVLQHVFSQNVSINASGNAPDNSAMLDVSSNTKGFLMPRMATTDRDGISLPATGLAIFNTTTNLVEVNIGTPSVPNWTSLSATGAIDTSSIANFYLQVRSELSAGTGISYDNSAGVISNAGVLSVNSNTGALTMDTGYITNFSQKVRSLSSATAPLTDSNGVIGITQATTSTNGYLSSTDWNTFNNNTTNSWSTSGNSVASNEVIGTTSNFDFPVITNNTERMRIAAGGDVGINNPSPTEILDVIGNINFSGALMPGDLPGNGGDVLTSQGSGVSPTWSAPSNQTITFTATGDVSNPAATGKTSLTPTLSIGAGKVTNTMLAGGITVVNGGTGLSTTTVGDIFYGGASNTIIKLAKSTTANQYLSNSGTSNVPAWATPNGASSYSHGIFTPSTGNTITMVKNQYNIINPSGTLSTLTVTLPSSPAPNDVVYIKYSKAITTVTYSGGTVVSAPASPTAGQLVVLVYDSGTSTWY